MLSDTVTAIVTVLYEVDQYHTQFSRPLTSHRCRLLYYEEAPEEAPTLGEGSN